MTDEDRALLMADVKIAEGWRSKAYQDSVGVWTVGYGRNLQELVIDKTLGHKWLASDLQVAEGDCRRAFSWFDGLSPVRQRVLVEMAFNLGLTRLRGFVHMLVAVEAKDFQRAADHMLQSKWATQVGQRSTRLADMMRTG